MRCSAIWAMTGSENQGGERTNNRKRALSREGGSAESRACAFTAQAEALRSLADGGEAGGAQAIALRRRAHDLDLCASRRGPAEHGEAEAEAVRQRWVEFRESQVMVVIDCGDAGSGVAVFGSATFTRGASLPLGGVGVMTDSVFGSLAGGKPREIPGTPPPQTQTLPDPPAHCWILYNPPMRVGV